MTDEQIDALRKTTWAAEVRGDLGRDGNADDRYERALVRAGMLEAARIVDAFADARENGIVADWIQDLANDIRTAARGTDDT